MSASDKQRRGFVSPHPAEVHDGAVAEFVSSWQTFSSPSAAAVVISKRWRIGRTTLIGWLKDKGVWPTANVADLRTLQAENMALRDEIRRLRRLG